MKRKLYTSLTLLLLIMAICQAPFFYFYSSGLLFIFVIFPYLIIALSLTIFLLFKVRIINNKDITTFHKRGLDIAFLIGTVSLFLGNTYIEKLDWQLRTNTRNEIVEKCKTGELKPNNNLGNNICNLGQWYFPPISNGGNAIKINKRDNTIRVEFYIDRGFLGRYSAFIYTNNPEVILEFENRILNDSSNNYLLEENWYRILY